MKEKRLIRKISAGIQDLLRSPDSAELDGGFSARLMRTLILWLMGGATTVGVGLFIYLESGLRVTAVALMLGFVMSMLILLWTIRRGYEQMASAALGMIILAFVHISAVLTGGADSPFISGYPVAVVVAGLLAGRRSAAIVGGLSLASFWYVLVTPSGAALDIPSIAPIAKAIVYGVVMILLVICLYLARTLQLHIDREARAREMTARTTAEKYRVLVEKLPIVVHVAETGEHGAWVYISPQVEDMLGFSAEAWIADPDLWARQIHPEDRQRVLADEEKLSKGLSGESTHWEYRFLHRDGHVVWLQDNAVLTWDEDLRKYLWHGTFVDISRRQQAEEETQRLSRELFLLDAVRSALAHEVELPALLRTVVESIADAHGYRLVSVYLLEAGELVLQHQVGYQNLLERIPLSRGVMGRVARTGQPAFVEDIRLDKDYVAAIEGIVSEISVPLFDNGNVAGVINLESTSESKLTENDLKLMLALSEHINVALGRARLFSDLQRKNRIEAALQESTRAIMAEMESAEVLQAILDQSASLMDVANAFIYLISPEEDALVMVTGTGIYTQILGTKLKRGEGMAGKIWESAQPLNLKDYHSWSGRSSNFEDTLFRSVLGVPLISGARVIGVLGLAHLTPEQFFNKQDMELLSRFAQLASIALENARLFTLSQQELFERKQTESLQSAVYRISEAANKVSSLAELFQSVHAIIGAVMPASNFYIALYDSEQGLITFPYYVDELDTTIPERATRLGRGLTEYVLRTGQALLCDAPLYEEMIRAGKIEQIGPLSPVWLGAPLITDGRTIGVIALQDYANPLAYGERELHMLEYVSAQVAKAIAAKNADEALRQSEGRYRGALNNMIEGCRIIGFDWRYIYVNEAAARQGRSSVEELIGQSMTELFPWIQNTPAFNAMRTCMEERVPVYMETEFTAPDGPMNWFELSIQPVPEGIFVLSVDITENKKASADLKEATDSLQTVINSSPLAILGYDRDGVVKTWNPAAEKIFGWDVSEAVGKIAPYIRPQELVVFHALRERVVGGETILGVELRRHKKDGTAIDISLNLAPTYDANRQIDGYMALIEDISARKQRQRELTALASVSAALRVASTRAEIMLIVLDQVIALLHASGATLALYDLSTGEGLVESAAGIWKTSIGMIIPPGKGASGKVMSTGRPYVTANSIEDEVIIFANDAEKLPAPAFVSVPLSTPNGLLGTINVGRADPFTAEEVGVLENVADMAANAIQRTASHELAVRRVSQLQALHNIEIAITSSLDLRVTLNVLLDHTIAQLNVDAASIFKMSASLHKLSFAAGRGFESTESELDAFDRSTSFAGRVSSQRKSIIITEIRQETMPIWFSGFLVREKFVAYIGVPLIAKGTLVGVLEVFHRSPIQATSEWVGFLETLATQAALAMDNAELFTDLQQSNRSLALSYDATIEGWSRALDLRDEETEGHTQRVTELTVNLARIMQIPEEQITHMRRGALLHDIGKMGIPDSILLKPSELTEEETQVMHQHPQYAYDLIAPIRYLQSAMDIPFCHHEKWDGSGYPRGLAGERIPLAARIFSVVDVWDALTSDRPYREAWPEDKALAYIRMNSGTYFDPHVVEVFLKTREKFS